MGMIQQAGSGMDMKICHCGAPFPVEYAASGSNHSVKPTSRALCDRCREMGRDARRRRDLPALLRLATEDGREAGFMSLARHLNPQVRGPHGRLGPGVPRPQPPRVGRGHEWPAEDEAFLATHYDTRGPAWVAAKLARTPKSCVHKAAQLRARGVSVGKLHAWSHDAVHPRAWSERDLAKAERLYAAGWALDAIGRAVDRSATAVYHQAHGWGWERPANLAPIDVARILGRSPAAIHDWIAWRWLDSAPGKVARQRAAYVVKPQFLRAFLADYRNVALWTVADVRADWRGDAARLRPRYLTTRQALAAGVAYTEGSLLRLLRLGTVPGLRVRGRSGRQWAIPCEAVARFGGRAL